MFPSLRGDTFLSLNKKVSKELSIGEALTTKPIESAVISFHFSPASSRPPLCTPPGAGRKTYCNRFPKNDYIPATDGGREGVWGEGGSRLGVKGRSIDAVPKDLAVSASPQPLSFTEL